MNPPNLIPILFFTLVLSAAAADLTNAAAAAAPAISVPNHPAALTLPFGHHIPASSSPGARPNSIITVTRLLLLPASRLHRLLLFSHALHLRINITDPAFRIHPLDFCLHRNVTLGLGACAADKWVKVGKPGWEGRVSPFEVRVLDVRMVPDPSRVVEFSTEYQFLVHRLVFLVVGVVMMVTAGFVSRSVVFYYGGAMTIGVILVVLMILFQGMKLLPTGRKSSLVIFMYSSVVGVATFLLSYLSGLMRSMLIELGISEDMHNPLGIFLLMCVVLGGAWFGYWSVRKVVLTDDGVVDSSVAYFVEWAILIFAAVMILQSSLDPLLAVEALSCAIIITAIARTNRKAKFLRRMFKHTIKCTAGVVDLLSPSKSSQSDSHPRARHSRMSTYNSPNIGLTRTSPQTTLSHESFYSTFHKTPERKKLSKEEWDSLTKEQTQASLKSLISSPDFNDWALKNADRIMVTPPKELRREEKQRRFWWF